MRDPKRIDSITAKLTKAWHLVPDFRFWQFVTYLLEFMPDNKVNTQLFYWEDDVWDKMLDDFIEGAMIKDDNSG